MALVLRFPWDTRQIASSWTPGIDRIYVANAGSGNISVIDGTTDRVVKTLPGEEHPYAIGFDSALHRAYVTNTYSNKVTMIDTATNQRSTVAGGLQRLC